MNSRDKERLKALLIYETFRTKLSKKRKETSCSEIEATGPDMLPEAWESEQLPSARSGQPNMNTMSKLKESGQQRTMVDASAHPP